MPTVMRVYKKALNYFIKEDLVPSACVIGMWRILTATFFVVGKDLKFRCDLTDILRLFQFSIKPKDAKWDEKKATHARIN